MSKSILVIDTPNYCAECPCSDDCTEICRPIDKLIVEVNGECAKPDWCPLLEISESTKRLTFCNPDGTWGLKSGYDIKKVPKELYLALYKLKEYEDTGLSPDQVEQLNWMYSDKCHDVDVLQKQIDKLHQAARNAIKQLETYQDEAEATGALTCIMGDMIEAVKEALWRENEQKRNN